MTHLDALAKAVATRAHRRVQLRIDADRMVAEGLADADTAVSIAANQAFKAGASKRAIGNVLGTKDWATVQKTLDLTGAAFSLDDDESENTPRFTAGPDGTFILTVRRDEYPAAFEKAHAEGDTASATFKVSNGAPVSVVDRLSPEGLANAALVAFYKFDELKLEGFEWASQHAN